MDTKQIKNLIEDTSRQLVENHFPAENHAFDLVWNAFWEHLKITGFDDSLKINLHHNDSEPVVNLGALAGGAGQQLDTMWVIGSLTGAAAALMQQDTSLLKTKDVRNAIHEELLRMQVPDHVKNILDKYASPLLAELFEIKKTKKEKPTPIDSWYVEQLLDGKHSTTRPYTPAKAKGLIGKHQYDLIIDEPSDKLILASKEQTLYGVSPILRGMIWLTLTNIGGKFTFDEIGTLFGFGATEDSDAISGRIHQYRARLNKLLGTDLSDSIFAKGINKAYSVRANEWSFCWIRKNESHKESELLYLIDSPTDVP